VLPCFIYQKSPTKTGDFLLIGSIFDVDSFREATRQESFQLLLKRFHREGQDDLSSFQLTILRLWRILQQSILS
jgi:hypothetical protein